MAALGDTSGGRKLGLAEYGEYVHRDDKGRPLKPARHHQVWIEALEDESIERLLIIAPPGHAKSVWCSVVFPAWWIGKDPERSVILASNTATLAELSSVAVRDTIEQNEKYHEVFPGVVPDKAKGWAQSEWFVRRKATDNRDPTVAAGGADGSMIGRRADLIIFDDPHNEKNVATKLQRDKVKRWYKRTLMSRLRPGGQVVVIMTRWHHDDLAADLIAEGYRVVHMPAIGFWGEGTALWPEEYPLEALEAKRKRMGAQLFEGMYQGRPTPLEGALFKRSWFRYFEETDTHYCLYPPDGPPQLVLKERIRKIQSVDLAASTKETADYFVDGTLGLTPEKDLLILDVMRDRIEGPDQPKVVSQLYRRERPECIAVEQVAYQLSFVQRLQKEEGLPVKGVKPDKDKVSRAMPVAVRYENGQIYHRRNAAWLDTFESELLEFPAGSHDDQVDMLTQGAEELYAMGDGFLEFMRSQVAPCLGCGTLLPKNLPKCPKCGKDIGHN